MAAVSYRRQQHNDARRLQEHGGGNTFKKEEHS
jgi:hypothetical protein